MFINVCTLKPLWVLQAHRKGSQLSASEEKDTGADETRVGIRFLPGKSLPRHTPREECAKLYRGYFGASEKKKSSEG